MVFPDPRVRRHCTAVGQVVAADPAVLAHGAGPVEVVPLGADLPPACGHGARAVEVVPLSSQLEPARPHGARAA